MPAPAEELVAPIIRRFEGLRLKVYLCPANVWTIGYGATLGLDGKALSKSSKPITEEQAEELLARDIARMSGHVRRLVKVAMSESQRAALVDFTYNLGPTNLKSSTLLRRVNDNEWDDVPAQIRRWVNAGGVRLPGLVLRREMDVELWVQTLIGMMGVAEAPPLPAPRPQRPAVPMPVVAQPSAFSRALSWLASRV